jgi:hypothetical protein
MIYELRAIEIVISMHDMTFIMQIVIPGKPFHWERAGGEVAISLTISTLVHLKIVTI